VKSTNHALDRQVQRLNVLPLRRDNMVVQEELLRRVSKYFLHQHKKSLDQSFDFPSCLSRMPGRWKKIQEAEMKLQKKNQTFMPVVGKKLPKRIF
jgi:hypothetical protein